MSEEADTEVGVDSKDKTDSSSKTKAKVRFYKVSGRLLLRWSTHSI